MTITDQIRLIIPIKTFCEIFYAAPQKFRAPQKLRARYQKYPWTPLSTALQEVVTIVSFGAFDEMACRCVLSSSITHEKCFLNSNYTDQDTNFTLKSERLVEAKVNKQKMEFVA